MSEYLKNIIENKNQICEMQIVFVDIVKYSMRRTAEQVKLINEFTTLIKKALLETNKMHFESLQSNSVSLISDSILIPTGDGIAIGMPFTWINTLHLDIAINILKEISKLNESNKHTHINSLAVRIGISAGTVILYKDINSKYNIAGNSINMAARVMNYADVNQIMFTKEAYELFNDLNIGQHKFIELKNRKIKHNLFIDLYQFVDESIKYINSNISQIPTDYSDEELKLNQLSNLVDLVMIDKGSFIRQFDGKKIPITKEFAVSKNPITQHLYEYICKDNPSYFNETNNPVENITFLQAIKFCNKLSIKEGYESVYSILPDGIIEFNQNVTGYRLPFEFEFDYLLSLLLKEVNSISDLKPWLNSNSNLRTHTVKDETKFIINDLIGNVWEWCFDNYLSDIKYETFSNLYVKIENNKTRVVKGGSYSDILTILKENNYRSKRMQEKRNKNCGFRIILQNLKQIL